MDFLVYLTASVAQRITDGFSSVSYRLGGPEDN